MPKRYPMRRKMKGGSKFGRNLMKWMGNANSFLKRSGLLSTIGREFLRGKDNRAGNAALGIASQLGYGKRKVRRRVGGSLAPVGGMYSYGRR